MVQSESTKAMTLKDFRQSKELTQERLAHIIGVTVAGYNKVETGKTPASRIFIEKMKAVFPEIGIVEMFFPDLEG